MPRESASLLRSDSFRRLTVLVTASALIFSSANGTARAQAGHGHVNGTGLAREAEPGETAPGSVDAPPGPVDLTLAAGALTAAGLDEFPVPGSVAEDTGLSVHPDPAITATEVLSVEPSGRGELWTVTSASMQRVLRVEVLRAPSGAPAPMLYLLDGVGSEFPSDFRGRADVDTYFADEDVTVVMPSGANGSMWADWDRDDPVTGRHKWETFLTRELPPLLEAEIPFNGRRAVAGISMGAAGALNLAARFPDHVQAVAGISGAYSTTSDLGYHTVRLTVNSRGAEARNMWGPRGSESWRARDTVASPDGLRGKAIYLSTGNGLVGQGDIDEYGANVFEYLPGAGLEQGSFVETQRLSLALDARGIPHRVDYTPTGLHNWDTFSRQLDPAWRHMATALY